MEKALLIAEKTSLKNTIKAAYDKNAKAIGIDLTFMAQSGHLTGLKTPDELNPAYKKWRMDNYPMDLRYEYRAIPNKKDLLSRINSEINSGKYDFIIHAGDADGEGEILVRQVLALCGNRLPVKRFWSNDLTDGAIVYALTHLRDDSELDAFAAAAWTRQHADYQYGMNLTCVFTLGYGALVKIGRVKAAVVRLVYDREKEISEFVDSSVWRRTFSIDGWAFEGVTDFKTPGEAGARLPKTARVSEVVLKTSRHKPPLPYKLSTLQTDAWKKYRVSAAGTLSAAQSLYMKGFSSYPRTGCEYLSSATDANGILASAGMLIDLPRDTRFSGKERCFNDKKVAEESHTALIPTGKVPGAGDMSGDEEKIYEMILRRFAACAAPDKVCETATYNATGDDGEDYVSRVTRDIDPGFELVLNPDYETRTFPRKIAGLPATLPASDARVKEIKAKPPARYNDGSIIAAMEKQEDDGEKFKIGTQATRAAIIEQCRQAGYFTKRGGKYYATELTRGVIHKFGSLGIFDLNTTAAWERQMDDIRSGRIEAPAVEAGMLDAMNAMIAEVKRGGVAAPGSARGARSGLFACPLCGGSVYDNKKSYSCGNWREKGCRFAIWKESAAYPGCKITAAEARTLAGGGTITKKLTFKSGKSHTKKLGYNPETNKVEWLGD